MITLIIGLFFDTVFILIMLNDKIVDGTRDTGLSILCIVSFFIGAYCTTFGIDDVFDRADE